MPRPKASVKKATNAINSRYNHGQHEENNQEKEEYENQESLDLIYDLDNANESDGKMDSQPSYIPSQSISTQTEDAGNNFSLQLQYKMIFRLQLQLQNEKNEFITDAPDYTAVIQYNIYEKQDDVVKITIVSLLKLLNDFYISFLTLAQSMRLL